MLYVDARGQFYDYIISQYCMQFIVSTSFMPQRAFRENDWRLLLFTFSPCSKFLYGNGPSINTERQEQVFITCNNITSTTSNRQAKSMLNILVRVQSKMNNTTLQKQGAIPSLTTSPKQMTVQKRYNSQHRVHPCNTFANVT